MASSSLAAAYLTSDQIQFNYQQMIEPFDKFSCQHVADTTNPFDWLVDCKGDGKTHRYLVHLALTFYPRTHYGVNSYELLYWITDRTEGERPVFHSTTVWVHNSSKENRIKILEAGLGVDGDTATLRLVVKVK